MNSGEKTRKKIFISPERRKAPHAPYVGMVGVYEHDVCCEIGEHLKAELEFNGFEVVVAVEDDSMGARCDYANGNKMDYYLCIHTNAAPPSAKGQATGCECLYYYNGVITMLRFNEQRNLLG